MGRVSRGSLLLHSLLGLGALSLLSTCLLSTYGMQGAVVSILPNIILVNALISPTQ